MMTQIWGWRFSSNRISTILQRGQFSIRITFSLAVLTWTFLSVRQVSAQVNVTTWHNDNALTGGNTSETVLKLANVSAANFGLVFSCPVDGYVYAQPLYVSNLTIPGKGPRNVVFVATEHDSVYAFDADNPDCGPGGSGLLWKDSFITPPNITTVPNSDINSGDIVPEIGITGTPVIDPGTNTLYVVPKTKEMVGGIAHYVQRLHALDIVTGAAKHSPVDIGDTTIGGPDGGYTNMTSISISGKGNGSDGTVVRFNALRQLHRPALTLTGNGLYISWASHGDNGPYHGWVVRYNKTTLAQEFVFNTTPNGGLGGIWQSGAGLSVDSSGNLYFATGNGTFARNATDRPCAHVSFVPCDPAYSDSVVKLDPTLNFFDHFTPFNQAILDAGDADLGSGGTTIIPEDQPGSHPHLIVETGKQGRVYLMDRDDLGKYQRCGPMCDDVAQVLDQGITGVWSTPAFFNGRVYYHGSGDVGKAFQLVNGSFNSVPVKSNASFGFPGATPSVSANGTSDGIVWELQTDAFGQSGPAILHASDAADISKEIYTSNQTGLRDQPGGAVKFTVPTVVNGKVYVGTQNSLAVFGLFFAVPPTTPPDAPTNLMATTFSFSQIDLSWNNVATNATGNKIFRSTDGSNFTQVNTVGRNATTYSDKGLVPSTVYFYKVVATNPVGDSADSNIASAKTKILPPTLRVADVCPGQINLAWTATADDHYDIERSTDGSTFAVVSTVDASTTSFPDSGLALGTYLHRVRAFNADGDFAVSNTTRATIGAVNIDHSTPPAGGFVTHDELVANGSAQFTNENLLRLNNNFGQAGSAFTVQPVGIRGFTTKFRIRLHEGTQPDPADGLTFTLQGNSPTALGGGGGALGYAGIGRSVAIKFDVFDNEGESFNSTGLFFNGDFPGLPHSPGEENVKLGACDDPNTAICLRNQNPKNIVLAYDGTTLTETITDEFTNKTFTHAYTVDIPSKLGGDTAFAGFTGGTGGLFSLQDVTSWKYDEQEGNLPPRAPGNVRVANVTRHDHNRSDITITWNCNNSYTAQGYIVERSTDGLNFTPILTINDLSMTTFTEEKLPGATYFYRVRTFNDRGNSGPSSVASLVLGGGDNGVVIDHSAGFGIHPELTANGSANFTGTLARLTDGGFGEAGSVFVGFNSGGGVSNFATTFAFQITPGTNPMADGMTFVIQGNSPTALGPSGGGLGYGPDNSHNPNRGIRNSVAVKFDIFQNESETDNATGLFSDGRAPTIPTGEANIPDISIPLDKSVVDLKSTHPFRVDMDYQVPTLNVTITDTFTNKSAKQSYNVDIPSLVTSSSNVFFVGFTGGTGGLTAIQDILQWTFQTAGEGGGTFPRSVSLTAPPDGSLLALGNITFSANPFSISGVNKVDFIVDGAVVGTATTPPYSITTSTVPAGNHVLTAVLTDNAGGSATSTPVNFRVVDYAGRVVTYGRSININFRGGGPNGTPSLMAAAENAGVVSRTNWNNAEGQMGLKTALVNDMGSPTSASVTWASNNTWSLPGVPDTPGNLRMMKGYLDTTNTSTTLVQLSNLPASFTKYDVYVYFDGDNGGASRTAIFKIGNALISGTDGAGKNFSGTFTLASGGSEGNFVLFPDVTGNSFTISGTPGPSTDGAKRASVNGIQVIAIQ